MRILPAEVFFSICRRLSQKLRTHRRIERVGGDFFKDIPVQADAYVMRWILHDWSDDESVVLLEQIEEEVAKPNARLMVVESVIPETREFDMGKWMDVNMMVMIDGGRERTAAEFRNLLDQAGFELEGDHRHAFTAQHRHRQAACLNQDKAQRAPSLARPHDHRCRARC